MHLRAEIPMSSAQNKFHNSTSPSIFTTRNLVLASIGWGIFALLYFLLFSAKIQDGHGIEKRAQWYLIGTYILEAIAYLNAAILCMRNWRSSQIVNGRKVWLAIAIGMFSYFIGGIIFDYIEIVLNKGELFSQADIFFVITYLSLGAGMILAVASRKIKLEKWQWMIVLAIGALGSSLAWLISSLGQDKAASNIPAWQENIASMLDWFYITSDVVLLIVATTLLLAFGSGRAAMSWRMIAAAAFSLYIADMWYKYATNSISNYQSGEILEVFWVWSGVLFSMGAALEYEASLNRSRPERGRRKA